MLKISTIDKEKMHKIAKKLYLEELLGKIDVSNHQQLQIELEKLVTIATEYLFVVLSKQHPPSNSKTELIEQIRIIDSIASTSIPNYKKSLIYFDEDGKLLTDTI